jgi:hypothetical protein
MVVVLIRKNCIRMVLSILLFGVCKKNVIPCPVHPALLHNFTKLSNTPLIRQCALICIHSYCILDKGRVFWSSIKIFKMCIASPILVMGSVNGSQNVYCVSDYCQRLWHMYSSIRSEYPSTGCKMTLVYSAWRLPVWT